MEVNGALFDYGSTVGLSILSGGSQTIFSGGFDSGTVVFSGGREAFYSGAVALAGTVSNGGTIEIFGSVNSLSTAAVTTSVSSGQVVFITVLSGGYTIYFG